MILRVLLCILCLIYSFGVVLGVPATPVNTPRAHPRAPNPHTSVGLFWIYTDPNTGRQWTGGTYKVKRCTGGGCTPTTVIATGLVNADFQDTGLSTNTTYGYTYLANDGSDSGDSPIVYVTTLPLDSNLVQWPNSTYAELLGPQVEAASIPYSWFNSAATSTGQTVISKFPVVGPIPKLLGTASISNGSTGLTGSGTVFLEQLAANNPACLNHISINGVDAGTIASVNSNTSATLTTPWPGATVSGALLSTNVPLCGIVDPINDYLTGNQLMYYDSPMALWQLYFRTGDPQYLRGAIKGSESIFAAYMWLGRNRAWGNYSTTANEDNITAPRNFQFSGYVLLGMAGHSGVWDLLDKFLDARYMTWLGNYRGGLNNFQYVREKAYMILFTSWFVTAAPDSYKRSDGSTTSLNGSITVDGSLATGKKDFWRDQLDIDVPGFIASDQFSYGFWLDTGGSNSTGDGDYPYFSGELTGPAQPFIQGLVADGLGYCWRNSALSTTARNAARKAVLKAVAAIGMISYNTNRVPSNPSIRHRALCYFNEGGTRLNPYAFQHCSDIFMIDNVPYTDSVKLNRQSNPLVLSALGWAKEMAGADNPWYQQIADEIANAAFAEVGENVGGTGDGHKSLCDNSANLKDFGQCFRTAGRYFGHRELPGGSIGTRPVVTMPSNMTLTGGVNQAVLTAGLTCTNAPCNVRWVLQEYALVNNPRYYSQPVFTDKEALSTKLCGLEPGTYKVLMYALDSLGLEDHGVVTVTVGDGIFPPTVAVGYGNPPQEELHQYLTTSSSLTGSVRAYSASGRTLSHSFSLTWPNDKSAPTFTPSGTTGNVITFTISGLSPGLWTITDTVTDSGGAKRQSYMYIRHTAESQPSAAHNTIPQVSGPPNHILPAGSTSTRLFVAPRDPEGIASYTNPATGYFLDMNGSAYVVGQLIHSWSQILGPATATLTNQTTNRLDVAGLTVAGLYRFRYVGLDQQGQSVMLDIDVTVLSGSAVIHCNWGTIPPCQ